MQRAISEISKTKQVRKWGNQKEHSQNKGKYIMNNNSIELTSKFWSITKKQIHGQALSIIEEAPDAMEAYAAAMRLGELAAAMKAKLKPECLSNLEDEPVEVAGGTMSWRAGGFRYSGESSFGHCSQWQDLQAEKALLETEIKRIEGLMKQADKNKGVAFVDEETGEEIPAAIPVPATPQLMYKY